MNEHPSPILMKERERLDDNKDNFYACPKYMRKDEKHDDGFIEGEKGCLNRLPFSVAGDIIFHFNNIVQKDLENGIITDYEGFKFNYKNQYDVWVLKDEKNELSFGILNRKAVENGRKKQ